MIIRSKVRRKPRSKKFSKMTGLIYVFNYKFAGKSVVVMDIDHYNSMRKQIVKSAHRLSKIKRMAGDVNVSKIK